MLGGYDYLTGVGLQDGCYRQLNIVTAAQKSPAAGADFSVQVPDGGYPWQLVAVRAQLVTSAVVVNRFAAAVVKDAAGTELYRVGFGTALVASTTYIITLSPFVGSVQGDVTNTKTVTFPVPDAPYLPRFSVGTITTAIDAGDAYSNVVAWYAAVLPHEDEADDE